MTPKQKRIIAVLLIANVLLIVASFAFLTPLASSVAPLGLPTPVPTSHAEAHFWPACQRQVIHSLSQAGLGGTATLTDHTLEFDLVYRIPEDGDDGDVAQQVWTTFDVLLEVANDRCETFTQVEITIEGQGVVRPNQVHAAVAMADLKAFGRGELDESAFIERVEYRVEPVHDGEL